MTRTSVAAIAGMLLLTAAGAQAQTPAAVAVAEKALMQANDATPVVAAVATLVEAKAVMYGDYAPRPSNHYTSGEAILFYVEPVGLKHKADGALLTCGLTMDLVVKQNGASVYGKEGFLVADFPSHHALQEIMLNGSLTVNAPAASYELELVLHDHNSAEVARVTLPFVIDAAPGETAK